MFRGCFTIGVYGATIQTWVSVCYNGGVGSSEVSIRRGSTVCGVCSNVVFIILPPVASAPTNMMAVQEGPTSIRVSWSPPTPLGDTTGYRIYYSGSSSGSEDVSDGSTDNYLLTGLQNGESYTISIVAGATTSSQLLPSDTVTVNIILT